MLESLGSIFWRKPITTRKTDSSS